MSPVDRLLMQITFLSAFIFLLLFYTVLKGQLTSLLTRQNHHNVESLKDLRDNKYHGDCDLNLLKETVSEKVSQTNDSINKHLYHDIKYNCPIY